MKRLLSSALLFAALPLLAQAPPAPADGTGGPDGRGHHGGGMGMHGIPAPVTGAPYTAQISTASSMKLQDGTPVTHVGTRTVYRDSQGRTREEMTFTPPAQGTAAAPRSVVVIFDPVAHTVTRLNPERKVAVVETVPDRAFNRAEKRVDHELQDPAHAGHNATATSLGTKTIAGVSATGERISRAMPAADGAANETATREVWTSTDLKIPVSSTETDPFHGTHSMNVTGLTRTEPDASLFQVPSDYTVKQAPAHERGMHHGPAGGPEAPAPPADAPPSGM